MKQSGNWQQGGFRDMSRLAGSDIQMIADIVSTNTQSIAVLLAQFRVQLAVLETMLLSRDERSTGRITQVNSVNPPRLGRSISERVQVEGNEKWMIYA